MSEPLDSAVVWTLPDLQQRRKPQLSQEERAYLAEQESLARAQGFAQGKTEGLAAAEAEIHALKSQIHQLLAAFAKPFFHLEQQVTTELAALAIELTRLMIGRDPTIQRDLMLTLVKEALATLSSTSQEVSVHLHPSDAALISPDAAQTWKLVPDPEISVGGCLIKTPVSRIDATIETRLQKLWKELLDTLIEENAER